MRRFAGCQVSVVGCALVAVAATAAFSGGAVAIAQVRLGGELGWQGQAVAGEVNPLTITVDNGTRTILSGVVRAEQRVGSGWRGQVAQRLRVPVVLAPGGRTRFVFPWPVEAGSDPITLSIEAGGTELARATLPLRPTVEKPVAVVGALAGPSARAVVVLAPEELPTDPLLLDSFSEVQVAPTAFISAAAQDALRAWVAFGGGVVTGMPTVPAIAPLGEGELRQALRDHGPRPPPVGLLVGGTVIYLIAIGYALPSLSRRSSPMGVALVLTVSLACGLFYPAVFDTPDARTAIEYSLNVWGVERFSRDVLSMVDRRGNRQEIEGWWVERVVPGFERAARDVSWVWESDGPRTVVQVEQGQTLFLLRYGGAWSGGGWEEVVGPGARVTVESGFGPLLGAVGPLLEEGDRVFLDAVAKRRDGVARYAYRLLWERDG